jgi:monoamine oxidase
MHGDAIQRLGFGSVIKLIFLFREAFWFERQKDIGFLLSDEAIPTWWTQLPDQTPILTGWLGGPKAALMSSMSQDKIFEAGLSSLANIFGLDISILRKRLVSYKIMCWDNYSNVKGGYSYTTIDSTTAKTILQKPIDDTIYFAGEAIPGDNLTGTVEAALVSGKMAAGMITDKHSYAKN